MSSEDMKLILKLVSDLGLEEEHRPAYKRKVEMWGNEGLNWLAFSASGRKGSVGKKLCQELCKRKGFEIFSKSCLKKDIAFSIQGNTRPLSVCVKFSMLGEGETYVFEQIRDRAYEILLLLGISAHEIHVWAFSKDECWEYLYKQHSKAHGWVYVKPGSPHQWFVEAEHDFFTRQSGDLEDLNDELSGIIEKLDPAP